MTQPTSVDMTFDTSLVDLNASFSTTESDTSEASMANPTASSKHTPTLQQGPLSQDQETPKQSQAGATPSLDATSPPPKPSTPVQHISTQDAYDQWASVYDSDGNMLQSIDDLELANLLPEFISQVLMTTSSPTVNFLDLGCGTGRNTSKLLLYDWPRNRGINITALDFSKGMLEVAAQKLNALAIQNGKLSLRLDQADCFPTVSNPNASPIPLVKNLQPIQPMNAVTSTLVLEHIPLHDYFATLSSLITSGGYALVTNMHSEMGRVSQAGFINEQGIKVRGKSFAHTPQETAEAAMKAGFEVLSIKERRMEKEDVEGGSVSERGWKWVGMFVWYGLVLRKVC